MLQTNTLKQVLHQAGGPTILFSFSRFHPWLYVHEGFNKPAHCTAKMAKPFRAPFLMDSSQAFRRRTPALGVNPKKLGPLLAAGDLPNLATGEPGLALA